MAPSGIPQSPKNNILKLSKSAFVAPDVYRQLIVLTGEPEAVVREVVRFRELFDGNTKIP